MPHAVPSTTSLQSTTGQMEVDADRFVWPPERPSRRGDGGPERLVKIYAGKLFDPHSLQLLPQRVVTVSEELGLVVGVEEYSEQEANGVDFGRDEKAIDLRDATVLPGFVDAHVHCEFMGVVLHPPSLCASMRYFACAAARYPVAFRTSIWCHRCPIFDSECGCSPHTAI